MEDDPLEQLLALKQSGGDPLEKLMAIRVTPAQAVLRREQSKGLLASRLRRVNENEAEASEPPSYAGQALGGIASLARDIPGAEAAQSYARAVTRGKSMSVMGVPIPLPGEYEKARTDIRGAEDSAPSVVRNANRVIGGGLAAAAIPGSATRQGARYGIASGLLQSDPDADAKDRIWSAGGQGLLGAAAGKVGDMAVSSGRALASRSLGSQALKRKAAMAAEDATNYGQAAAEGAAFKGQTPPALRKAVGEPDIKPYINEVLASRKFAGAPPETILMEAHKLMSERQGSLVNRIANADDFKAGTTLEKADVGLAKQELRDAMGQVMPSFPKAVERHAKLASENDAFKLGADAASRIERRAPVAGKKLTTKSLEAVLAEMEKMPPEEARAALGGIFGRVREVPGITGNPLSGFGVLSSAIKTPTSVHRVGPLIEALDRRAGDQWPRVLRSLGIAAGTPQSY